MPGVIKFRVLGVVLALSLLLIYGFHRKSEKLSQFIMRKSTPQVCIVSRTYEKQYSYLLTHLLSISHNPASKPLVLFVITDEKSKTEPVLKAIRTANSLIGYQMAHLLPITYIDAEVISADYKNDYGYSYTDATLNYLLEHPKEYPCDNILFTNGDNFYTTGFLDDYILPDIKEGIQIIGFNFVSRHVRGEPNTEDYFIDDKSKHEVYAVFQMGMIDLGAFVIDMKVVAAHPELRFITQSVGRGRRTFEADGFFIEHAASLDVKRRVHRQVLLVHQ